LPAPTSSAGLGLRPLGEWGDKEEHLLELVHVFDGEFSNPSDKVVLSSVLLGLYSLALQYKMQMLRVQPSGATSLLSPAERRGSAVRRHLLLFDVIVAHKATVFPERYFGNRVRVLDTLMRDAEFFQKHVGGEKGAAARLLKSKRWVGTQRNSRGTIETHLVLGERINHPTRGLGTIVAVKPGERTVRYDWLGVVHTYSQHSWTKLAPLAGTTRVTTEFESSSFAADGDWGDWPSDSGTESAAGSVRAAMAEG